MKRSVPFSFFLALAVLLPVVGRAQAQSPFTLNILNPVTPGTNVATVTQGDWAQVQYTVSTDFLVSRDDLVQLRRLDTDAIVSQNSPTVGQPSAIVFLSTAPSNAVGDLKAVYVAAGGTILATAQQVLRVTGTGPKTVTVPSPQARTIQAGIDAVANGGTVQIGPGTFRERLLITGKQVNLVGSGSFGLKRTLIAGAIPRTIAPYERVQGLISVGPGGGGSISHLILQGGDAGVVGLEDSRGAPAPVRIENTVIRMTGRGVVGSFTRLTMNRVITAGTLYHAVAITHSAALDFFNGLVFDAGGVGLLIYNTDGPPGLINIDNMSIGFCGAGGIAIVGGVKDVRIANSYATQTWTFGILLSYAGFVEIADTYIAAIYYGGGPVYQDVADGLLSRGSHYVWIHGLLVTGCDRSGLMFDSGNGGVIQNTRTQTVRFGLVLQGDPKPDYSDPANVFQGTDEPILTDGALPVPAAPPLPDGP